MTHQDAELYGAVSALILMLILVIIIGIMNYCKEENEKRRLELMVNSNMLLDENSHYL